MTQQEQSIEILTESQILSDLKKLQSKLKSQEEHLNALVAKKSRLDSEIRELRRAIAKNIKVLQKDLKTKKIYSPATESFYDFSILSEDLAQEAISGELYLEYKELWKVVLKIKTDLDFLEELLKKFPAKSRKI